jgi:hypothetical protein
MILVYDNQLRSENRLSCNVAAEAGLCYGLLLRFGANGEFERTRGYSLETIHGLVKLTQRELIEF